MLAQPGGICVRIEGRTGDQFDGGHHLITRARLGVGDGVDSGDGDVGVSGKHRFDGPGGKILRVDPQPISGAPGKVEETLRVDIPEVAGPVPPVAEPIVLSLGMLVVPLEIARARFG